MAFMPTAIPTFLANIPTKRDGFTTEEKKEPALKRERAFTYS